MHELHLAQTIINTALSALKKEGGQKITKIQISLNQNDHIPPQSFQIILQDLSKDIPELKDCIFEVKTNTQTYIKEIEIEK